MGIATGYCTVGNFGSDQRLDYTVLGSPVNLAARLQGLADPETVLVDQNTYSLIDKHVNAEAKGEFVPRGFSRPVRYYELLEFVAREGRGARQQLSHLGSHVEVNILDSSDIRGAIAELREIQVRFEAQLQQSDSVAASAAGKSTAPVKPR
jgi:adenylate cyclase